jgi:hypothetical protein
VIEKLRGLRTRAAELVEAAVEENAHYTPFRRRIGGGFAPTTRSSVSCARSAALPLLIRA